MKDYFKLIAGFLVLTVPDLVLAEVTEYTIDHLGEIKPLTDNLVNGLKEQNIDSPEKKIFCLFLIGIEQLAKKKVP